MGVETTHRTRKAILEADKDANPFLNGVPAILEALRSGLRIP
jgi:hypothetical protein